MPSPKTEHLAAYRAKRDFAVTSEPAPAAPTASPRAPLFVVQKHAARRAGLHWDFRLEHDGVLWSWAVPKGPSLDPGDRRVAIHAEDHPIDYADFQGRIPDGQYGAGTVETWDRGTWQALGDPEAGLRDGNLKFVLSGQRLSGRFTLARLHRRDPRQPEGWFLIKGHDAAARKGVDALALEAAASKPPQPVTKKPQHAVRGKMPDSQLPQLASLAETPPDGEGWLTEIKFDGYRLLAAVQDGRTRLLTRNGHDWTDRLPTLAARVAGLGVGAALLDGELVFLGADGVSSFPGLQGALKAGRDDTLVFFVFDLLHLDGWDLRGCRLLDRKAMLAPLAAWTGMLRISEHVEGHAHEMRRNACRMKLEGIICKRGEAPYRAGRGPDWLKVKCQEREEFLVLGWTPPAGSRVGIGALHVGYRDPHGGLQYAGGVGTGFDDRELAMLRQNLDGLAAEPPDNLLVAGDPLDPTIRWVRPELVAEVQFIAWSGAGRVRHAVYLGLREDKGADEVVRDIADPEVLRTAVTPRRAAGTVAARRGWHGAIPPVKRPVTIAPSAGIVVARAPRRTSVALGGVEVTHADRQLWPGITKRDLAAYWEAVGAHALRGLARRPLAVVRCPDGIGGEQFFQKNGHGFMPAQIREGMVGKLPYLALDNVSGLIAMAQMSAIELHPWGAAEADALLPDTLVFDLDPGEGVAFGDVVRAAHEIRERLQRLDLVSFCRTTGGKGLHIVVKLTPAADWSTAKTFCRAFAEMISHEFPERYLATLKIAERRGRILIDWLRNGLGATAVASFCPRARPGAGVATPLDWREVNERLDPAAFTIRTVPARLAGLKADPWEGYDSVAQLLPALPRDPGAVRMPATSPARSSIVVTRKPASRVK